MSLFQTSSLERFDSLTQFTVIRGGGMETGLGTEVLKTIEQLRLFDRNVKPGRMVIIPDTGSLIMFHERDGAAQSGSTFRGVCVPWQEGGRFTTEPLKNFLSAHPEAQVTDAQVYGRSSFIHLLVKLPIEGAQRLDSTQRRPNRPSLSFGEKNSIKTLRWEQGGAANTEEIDSYLAQAEKPVKILQVPRMNFVYLFSSANNPSAITLHCAPIRGEDTVATDSNFNTFFQTYRSAQVLEAVTLPGRSYAYLFFNLDRNDSESFSARRAADTYDDGVFNLTSRGWRTDPSFVEPIESVPGAAVVRWTSAVDSHGGLLEFAKRNPCVSALNCAVPNRCNFLILTTAPAEISLGNSTFLACD